MQSIYILFVELSDSRIKTLHSIIPHFNSINLLTAVSKFYIKHVHNTRNTEVYIII